MYALVTCVMNHMSRTATYKLMANISFFCLDSIVNTSLFFLYETFGGNYLI